MFSGEKSRIKVIAKNLRIMIFTIDTRPGIIKLNIRTGFNGSLVHLMFFLMKHINMGRFCQSGGDIAT